MDMTFDKARVALARAVSAPTLAATLAACGGGNAPSPREVTPELFRFCQEQAAQYGNAVKDNVAGSRTEGFFQKGPPARPDYVTQGANAANYALQQCLDTVTLPREQATTAPSTGAAPVPPPVVAAPVPAPAAPATVPADKSLGTGEAIVPSPAASAPEAAASAAAGPRTPMDYILHGKRGAAASAPEGQSR